MSVPLLFILVLLFAFVGILLIQQVRLRSEHQRLSRSSVRSWKVFSDRLLSLETRLQGFEDRAREGSPAPSEPAVDSRPDQGVALDEVRAESPAVPERESRPVGKPPLPFTARASGLRGPAQISPPKLSLPAEPCGRSSREPVTSGKGRDLEMTLGGNWLQKLGVGVLVVGVSLLLGYTFTHLGPLGKIAIAYLVAGALIGGGCFLEDRTGFRSYGHGLIGGGWALVYFTTYALHFVPATKILKNPLAAFLLLGLVAAGIIVHSLRYRSQVVTGLAYILGYVTVFLSHGPLAAAAATLVLTASLVWVCVRFHWTGLLLLGAAATHGSEGWHVVRSLLLHRGTLPGSEAAFGMVVFSLSWGFFLLPILASRALTANQKIHRQLMNLVNGGLYLGLAVVTLPTRSSLFWVLLGAGAVYLTLAAWVRSRGDGDSLATFTLLGGGILVAAVPLRWSGRALSWIWLVESQAFLVSGVRLRERWLRRLAWASLALLVGKLLLLDVWNTTTFRLAGVPMDDRSLLFLATAACLYASRAFLSSGGQRRELVVYRFFTYPAALLLALALSFLVPDRQLGLVWAVAAWLLIEAGSRRGDSDARAQGYALALASWVAALAVGFDVESRWGPLTLRAWGLALHSLLFYGMHFRLGARRLFRLPASPDRVLCRTFSYLASASLLVLVLAEWPALGRSGALGLLAALLILTGLKSSSIDLRLQGYALAQLAVVQLLLVSWIGGDLWSGAEGGVRFLVIGLAGGTLHCLFLVLRQSRDRGALKSLERSIPEWFSFLSVGAVAVLLQAELSAVWVAPVWAAGALCLVVAVVAAGAGPLVRLEGYALLGATILRTLGIHLWLVSRGDAHAVPTAVTVILFLGMAYACLLYAGRRQRWRRDWAAEMDEQAPGVLFFSTAAITWLLTLLEAPPSLLTVALATEALLFFSLGLVVRVRYARLTGLGMLLFCTLRVFFYDLSGLETVPRIVSFIALGFILLLVSFLYTRFGPRFRRYLQGDEKV